jgi:hypothetical protein
VPYIGQDLQVAFPSYTNIDDISGSFDGVTTSFPLTVGGVAPVPAPLGSNQCLISVDGVVQRPDDTGTEGFRLSGGNIIFSSAPSIADDFFGIILAGADYVNVGANFPDGTLGAPSITFDQDNDTGYYRSGSGAVSFASNGVAAGTWSSAGVTAPALIPTGSSVPANGVYLPAANTVGVATNGTGRLFVDASGNVGVGTPSPGEELQIGATTSASSTSPVTLSLGGQYTPQASISLSNLKLKVYDSGTDSAGLTAAQDGLSYVTAKNGQHIWYRADGAGTLSESFRSDASGRLGIGTSSPDAGSVLHVKGQKTTFESASGGSGFFLTGTDSVGVPWRIGHLDTVQRLQFSCDSASSQMSLDSSGRLGIGSTAPSAQLHVRDSANYNFTVAAGNSTTGMQIGNYDATDGYNPLTFRGSQYLFISTGGNERARIDSSGRLLVGTSSELPVYYNSAATWNGLLQVARSEQNAVANLSIWNNNASTYTTYGGAQIHLSACKSGTVGSHTSGALASGDSIATINFNASDGTNFRSSARIEAVVDGGVSTADVPGRLVFSTAADGTSSPAERMIINSSGTVLPATDNAYYLGVGSNRWIAVYAVNGTIQTSDKREKTEIQASALGIDFIKSLKPVSYKWNIGQNIVSKSDDGKTDVITPREGVRRHWGFIAQDVEESVNKAGVDFGGWLLEDKDDPDSRQALRYDQFIAPLTKALQEAIAKIETLEGMVAVNNITIDEQQHQLSTLAARLTALESA